MVAILGILAAVVLPNVGGFLATGNLAAANTEVATTKTASAAYYADGLIFPVTDSNTSFYPTYLDKETKSTYSFTTVGIVASAPTDGWALSPHLFTFSTDNQVWSKP